MVLAAAHLGGDQKKLRMSLKGRFLSALNSAQGTAITCRDDLQLEFDRPDIAAFLVERTVFPATMVEGRAHVVPRRERPATCERFRRAMDIIAGSSHHLASLIEALIGSIPVYRVPHRDGGSLSCAIGMFWLSPDRSWTSTYWAEMIVHEFVHNAVFLEDMVRGLMPAPTNLGLPGALSVSALRKTRRPFDKAFHSACVAIGMMHLYHLLGDESRVDSLLSDLRTTVRDMTRNVRAMERSGVQLLSDNGRAILDDMHAFVEAVPDFRQIAQVLQSASPSAARDVFDVHTAGVPVPARPHRTLEPESA